MAELNLVPNPTLLVVQGGVFLANIWLIDKLILKPYLKLKDARDRLTVGNQDATRSIHQEIENKSKIIRERLDKALDAARLELNAARQEATKQQEQMVNMAQENLERDLDHFRTSLKITLLEERAKTSQVVEGVSSEIYKKLFN